jgi:hypothetical protein
MTNYIRQPRSKIIADSDPHRSRVSHPLVRHGNHGSISHRLLGWHYGVVCGKVDGYGPGGCSHPVWKGSPFSPLPLPQPRALRPFQWNPDATADRLTTMPEFNEQTAGDIGLLRTTPHHALRGMRRYKFSLMLTVCSSVGTRNAQLRAYSAKWPGVGLHYFMHSNFSRSGRQTYRRTKTWQSASLRLLA